MGLSSCSRLLTKVPPDTMSRRLSMTRIPGEPREPGLASVKKWTCPKLSLQFPAIGTDLC